ncbi:expressed unknown protein [Seminavis robusta]|uniref:Uncharacterized protein n=1 Tax=Seminavis robusta TaxID=568900 RepID=A0A9N8D9G4_9STRA|nr:expressed unknown protein [Seminavis robusta]|eukprot:Sro47_g027790.1 n/a (533) ;mRNA; f:61471-63069
MPGPKMGPRPADFNEDLVRNSPTFHKWEKLKTGEKLRYACRDFIKGHDQDEERLMRRIMIARRNNLRDHAILKKARRKQDHDENDIVPGVENIPIVAVVVKPEETVQPRKRRPASTFSDSQVMKEMDVSAVEATRSYRNWMALKEGEEFTYNQKYTKGKEGHDWLLRKNIWRRMRYRRENKKMVCKMREDDPSLVVSDTSDTRDGGQQHQEAPKPQAEIPPSADPQQVLPPLLATAAAPASIDVATMPPTASEIVDQALSPLEVATSEVAIPVVKMDSEPPPLTGGVSADTPVLESVAGIKREISDADINMEHHLQQHPGKIARIDPEIATIPATATLPTIDPLASVKVVNPLPHTADAPPIMLTDTAVVLHSDTALETTIHHHHVDLPPPPAEHHHHDPHDDAALTAAAAATASASGAADDLVELSAVEAAVAAAASYVQYQNQAHHDDDDDDDVIDDDTLHHHHHSPSVVHNPLEAAANAAALDSAAKLAAAAAAQESTSHEEAMQVVLKTEDILIHHPGMPDVANETAV